MEQAVFTRGYSPVRDSAGQIVGVLTVAAETTHVTEQLQSLSEVAAALAGTLTLDDVARVALRYAITTFDPDQVAFAVDEGGGGWRMVRRVRGELLDEADERLPPLWRRAPADWPAPVVQAARSGGPSFTRDGQPLRDTAVDRHDQKIRALAALPLGTSVVRGGLAVGYQVPHTWSPAERALLAASAELIGQAAERARRFETQHGTAQLLQRSMLPEHLPDLPRLRIAARYDPGVDGNAAGGDFYDAFLLPNGSLGVVLGDVAGHDVQAAARMGQVRAALRALALADPAPDAVLAGLDRLVTSLGAEAGTHELFVTVAFGVIDAERRELTLSSAGHPAPLIRRGDPDGRFHAEYVDVPPGPPLGLGGRPGTTTVAFRPGDTLLLFSDGVVERRRQSLSAGLDHPERRHRQGRQRRPSRALRGGHRGGPGRHRGRRGRAGGRARAQTESFGEHGGARRADRAQPGPALDDRPAHRVAGARVGDRRGGALHQRADHQRAAARRHGRPGGDRPQRRAAARLGRGFRHPGHRDPGPYRHVEQSWARPRPDRGAQRRLGHRPVGPRLHGLVRDPHAAGDP